VPIEGEPESVGLSQLPRSQMPTVMMMGIVLIAASVVVLVWAFPTRR
jgi:hypothetical protein